jgi:hypothetical protein
MERFDFVIDMDLECDCAMRDAIHGEYIRYDNYKKAIEEQKRYYENLLEKERNNKMNIDKTILDKAIAHYGIEAQLDQCIEECLELALAIRRYKRKPSPETMWGIIDEVADVCVMTAQVAIITDTYQVQERIKFKLDRLVGRIGNETNSITKQDLNETNSNMEGGE